MRPKRYVLLRSESSLAGFEEQLAGYFEERLGRVKLIPVEGNPHAVIVRTTVEVAARLKDMKGGFDVQGRRI